MNPKANVNSGETIPPRERQAELVKLLREGTGVLDEPFHHDAIAVVMLEAADALAALSPDPAPGDYSAVERDCRGCMGPCGHCHEADPAPVPPPAETGQRDQQRLDAITELQQLAHSNRWYRVTAEIAIECILAALSPSAAETPEGRETCATCAWLEPEVFPLSQTRLGYCGHDDGSLAGSAVSADIRCGSYKPVAGKVRDRP